MFTRYTATNCDKTIYGGAGGRFGWDCAGADAKNSRVQAVMPAAA